MNYTLDAIESTFFDNDTNRRYQWVTYFNNQKIDETGFGNYSSTLPLIGNGSTYGKLTIGLNGADFINYLIQKHSYQFFPNDTLVTQLEVIDSYGLRNLVESNKNYITVVGDALPPIANIAINGFVISNNSTFYDSNADLRQIKWDFYVNGSFLYTTGYGKLDGLFPYYDGTTFNSFDAGTDYETLILFLSNETSYGFQVGDDVQIRLSCIDSNCYESINLAAFDFVNIIKP